MMTQMINSNTIAATGTRAEEIMTPPASIKAMVDETNKIIMETLLTMQAMIHTIYGAAPEPDKADGDKCLHDATKRLRNNAELLLNLTRDLQTSIAG